MDARTFWGWALKGTEGAVNILAMLAAQGADLSEFHQGELVRITEKLIKVGELVNDKCRVTG